MQRTKNYWVMAIMIIGLLTDCNRCLSQSNKLSYKQIPSYVDRALGTSIAVVTPNSYDLTQSLPSGFVKTGDVDYTNYLQQAINAHSDVVFPDFPILINSNGLKLRSNMKVFFRKNSLLLLQTNNLDKYAVLELYNLNGVEIYDAKIKGDRSTHTGQGGEMGMGIDIRSSSNITLINPNIKNCWGDGIYVGRLSVYDSSGNYKPSQNVTINNAVLDYNRRNGISVTCAKNVKIAGGIISNTIGTAPMAGVDLEPNSNKDYLSQIKVSNVSTFNNRMGIQVVLKKLLGTRQKNVDVAIDSHKDYGSLIGFRVAKFNQEYALNFKKITGQVTIDNSVWQDNDQKPLELQENQSYSAPVILKNVSAMDKKTKRKLTSSDILRTNKVNATSIFKFDQ